MLGHVDSHDHSVEGECGDDGTENTLQNGFKLVCHDVITSV